MPAPSPGPEVEDEMARQSHEEGRPGPAWRRAALVLVACAGLALLLSSDALHAALLSVLTAAEPLVRERPVLGMVLFTGLSAVSASLAFFSSSILIPAAVHGWGVPLTIALLWLGWLCGGVLAYGLGRVLRLPLRRVHAIPHWADEALRDLRPNQRFLTLLVLQLTLPSELPAYLSGALGIPLRIYVLALALAELPYAAITVLIGASVVERDRGLLLLLGIVGAAGVLAVSALMARFKRRRPPAGEGGARGDADATDRDDPPAP